MSPRPVHDVTHLTRSQLHAEYKIHSYRVAWHMPCTTCTCSSRATDVDPTTSFTDFDWWKQVRRVEAHANTKRWMDQDDAVTLVNTNAEALNISAWYARRRSIELKQTLWQWRAENTIERFMHT